jgi:phosphinothricin acetyltransferase
MAGEHDAAGVLAIYAPIVAATVISFEMRQPDVAGMAERIRTTLETHPWLVDERAGRVVGYAYCSVHRSRAAYRWAVDVSVYVSPDHHRRGVGRGLYDRLFAILATQGYTMACAGIALPNPGSVGLHEAMGFLPVGIYRRIGFKLGRWHDVGWWQRPLAAAGDPPAEPLPLPAVRDRLPPL